MLLFSDQILAPCLYPCELLINLSAMRLQSLYVLKSKKSLQHLMKYPAVIKITTLKKIVHNQKINQFISELSTP
jgi:hypothetical protein